MSAQTPQTDLLTLIEVLRIAIQRAEYAEQAEQDLERDLSHYKALCEELLTAAILISDALHSEETHGTEIRPYTDKAWEKQSFTIESARAALKKAQKDI